MNNSVKSKHGNSNNLFASSVAVVKSEAEQSPKTAVVEEKIPVPEPTTPVVVVVRAGLGRGAKQLQ